MHKPCTLTEERLRDYSMLALWDAAVAEHAVARASWHIAGIHPAAGESFRPSLDFGARLMADFGHRMCSLRAAGWNLETPAGVGAGL